MFSGHRYHQIDQHHCQAMPHQCRLYAGELQQMHQELPWGSCQVPQCQLLGDLLTSYRQEACSHANAQVHVASSTAHQLSWQWLAPSNYGDTHGTREEWTNLLCTAQGASVQVCGCKQDGAHRPAQAHCFLQAVSSGQQTGWHSWKDCQGQKPPKENKMAHLLVVHSRKLSYQQLHCPKFCNYHWSSCCDHNNHQPGYCHQDNWCHNCPCHNNKDFKNSKSYKKKDDRKHNHFLKKSNEAMHTDQSSSLSADNLSRRRSRSRSRSPLRSCSQSCSCLSSRSYDNHHVASDDCKLSTFPKRKYSYSSKSDDGRRIYCPEKSNTVFATFSTPTAKKGKRTHK